jgi:hypothetical protein
MTGGETALLGAAIGGGAALIGALGATFGSYKVTDRSIAAQVARDREQRLVEAYTDLIWLVYCVMVRVEMERPRMGLGGAPDNVPEITIIEETRIKTKVQAIGSTAVRDKLDLWRAMLNGFRLPLGLLDEIAGGPSLPRPDGADGREWAGLMADMNERREALRDMSLELEAAVRSELTGEAVSPSSPRR